VNAVTEPDGHPAAVLIRALEPLDGIALMAKRRGPNGRQIPVADLCRGPGNLTKALGITIAENKLDLAKSQLVVEDRGLSPEAVMDGPRIGITVAVERPWRFWIAGNTAVSGRRTRA
jgi:DNA-3-methyladenine glycosylase